MHVLIDKRSETAKYLKIIILILKQFNTANQPGCNETLSVSDSDQILMSPNLPNAYDM